MIITDTSNKINQKFFFIEESEKKTKIKAILKDLTPPILIFINEKHDADNISNFLSYRWKVGCLHGGKEQEHRENIMEKFRNGRLEILISTDVMSRGIDIKYLRHVINYDCPKSIFDYEHRIGRTGRMGRTGTAITFITPKNQEMLQNIRTYLQKAGQKIPQEIEDKLEGFKNYDEVLQ